MDDGGAFAVAAAVCGLRFGSTVVKFEGHVVVRMT
jgi:hypothetical protein